MTYHQPDAFLGAGVQIQIYFLGASREEGCNKETRERTEVKILTLHVVEPPTPH